MKYNIMKLQNERNDNNRNRYLHEVFKNPLGIQIILLELQDSLLHDQFYNLLKLVSKRKQEEILKLYFDVDKKLHLYAELLVRSKIIYMLGVSNHNISFEKNTYGKPYFRNVSEFYFNVSHTRNAVTVAFSTKEIGVDIERINQADLKITERFFNPLEERYIKESNNPNRAFFEVWTKKEAYLKCIGTGLYTPLPSFNVLSHIDRLSIYSFKRKNYVLSVCGDEFKKDDLNIAFFTEKEYTSFLTIDNIPDTFFGD